MVGNDVVVTLGGQSGNLELNVMLPVMARNLLESISLLERAVVVFTEKCVHGIEANRERCAAMVEQSLALEPPWCPPLATTGPLPSPSRLTKRAAQLGRSA